MESWPNPSKSIRQVRGCDPRPAEYEAYAPVRYTAPSGEECEGDEEALAPTAATLRAISDAAFAAGLAALQRHCAGAPREPINEDVDLGIFERTHAA
jgi:hypothetical protein